ncbi:MAG: hypothetical protein AVDCRST_MAG71-1538 [uncultured Lysobacter sp.]|uniref:Phytoene/squalene synthetase-like protein n=1 Tax=uncultured Lysobacter sp. TaxID=271060 RepID=A0A6J4LCB4_9GAMM|nr:MAG: hypothetical protein AVDCRST_MAG71-1538 [uncultured Lysobacter sp.]
MTAPAADATPDERSLADFIAKWRARWPEWQLAEVFVPAAQRPLALAWASLQQELLEAAWGGADARPGEAKLLWWQEELMGWSQGRRRHPLGVSLQRMPAPWAELARAVPALGRSRERPLDRADAFAAVAPAAHAATSIERALFGSNAASDDSLIAACWLAARATLHAEAAVPLAVLARTSAEQAPLVWRRELAAGWPASTGAARVRRLWGALARARLVCASPTDVPPAWRTLFTAWRAARN